MTVEVRYESGPFKSTSSDHLWLLLAVYEDDQPTGQVVVRVAPDLTEHVYGPLDPFWWFACRAGADRLHRDQQAGQVTPKTVVLVDDDMRRVLHETKEQPEVLVADSTVLRGW